MGNVIKRNIKDIDDVFNYKMDRIKNVFLDKNVNIKHPNILETLNLFEISPNKINDCFEYEMKKEIIADWYLDYLIGFYCKYSTNIELYINDIFICGQKLHGNSFTSIKCNPVPLYFLLQNHQNLNFKIVCDNDKNNYGDFKFLVFCSCYEILNKKKENIGFKSIFFCSKEKILKQIIYDKGNGVSIDFSLKKSDFIEIPMIHDFTEEYKKYLAKKTCDIIKDELLMISMNPNRLKYFLTNDEKRKYNIETS